ncbi:hypothetical protein ACMA1I_13340 [Pontibacter sp. 13R65]|uniref:hypothetical protein n=1 Tax=Pontibacter sp. 13R65 TaxID=3127458 RepID=UPI00301C0A0B
MTKFYKPILYTITVFLLVLLMHYMRCGVLEIVDAMSLCALFTVGLVLGVLGDLVEQEHKQHHNMQS